MRRIGWWTLRAPVLFVLATSLIAHVGCRSRETRVQSTSFKPPLLSDREQTSGPYRVGAGDTLVITVPGGRAERTVVAIDGTIPSGSGQRMPVEGKTIVEIERELGNVTVDVGDYNSQVVHVADLSEERLVRPIPYRGPETVAELLKRVGCPNCQRGFRVRIVRPSEDVGGEPQIFAERIDGIGNGEADTTRIQPGDYVYVERNFGRKGPLTLLSDTDFYAYPVQALKRVRIAQATDELHTR